MENPELTITHCPKFNVYIATVPFDMGTVEFNYGKDHKLAMPGAPIEYSRNERITKMGSQIVGYGSTRQAAELRAKLKLAKG